MARISDGDIRRKSHQGFKVVAVSIASTFSPARRDGLAATRHLAYSRLSFNGSAPYSLVERLSKGVSPDAPLTVRSLGRNHRSGTKLYRDRVSSSYPTEAHPVTSRISCAISTGLRPSVWTATVRLVFCSRTTFACANVRFVCSSRPEPISRASTRCRSVSSEA